MSEARKPRWAFCGLLLILAALMTPFTVAMAQEEGEPQIEEVTGLAGEETVVQTPAPQQRGSGLVTLFRQGGNFMYPLALCSIVALAVILERIYSFQRARTNTRKLMEAILSDVRQGNVQGAVDVCSRTRGPIASIIAAGLLKIERGKDAVKEAIESSGAIELSFLQRGLIVLASIVNIAPLLGFLGTVSGMINAFAAIAEAEQVSAKLVAKGIQEALITTATGLSIAIPVQVFHSIFVSRVDRYVIEMEEAAVDLVDALTEKGMVA